MCEQPVFRSIIVYTGYARDSLAHNVNTPFPDLRIVVIRHQLICLIMFLVIN